MATSIVAQVCELYYLLYIFMWRDVYIPLCVNEYVVGLGILSNCCNHNGVMGDCEIT